MKDKCNEADCGCDGKAGIQKSNTATRKKFEKISIIENDPLNDKIGNFMILAKKQETKNALAALSKIISIIDGGGYDGRKETRKELDRLRQDYLKAQEKISAEEFEKFIYPIFQQACGSIAAFILDGEYPPIGHRH
ncbi:MAG: hypothetical protein QW275_02290 [Candidatus Anstonellaceae archaeon]